MTNTTNRIVGYSVASPIINSANILIDNGAGELTRLPVRINDIRAEYLLLSDEAIEREANLSEDLRKLLQMQLLHTFMVAEESAFL